MRTQIINQQLDEERALYNLKHADVIGCTFAGPADGESALKESRDVVIKDCSFSLRYPLWHAHTFHMINSTMDEYTRAAIWYATDGKIEDSKLHGIKAVRECKLIEIVNSDIESQEFGWKSEGLALNNVTLTSEYPFFDSRNLKLDYVTLKGKYSFQYVENMTVENSNFDTKDAFWHSKNVTVKNSTIKGEYLGWYSQGLTLINCKIIGTQPLCYCEDLTLIDCEMVDTDLAFEYSDVKAAINGHVDSIKNPKSGTITVDSVGEIITEDPVIECTGEVIIRS